MIEIYVALGLLGLGYLVNQKKPSKTPPSPPKLPSFPSSISTPSEKPSMKNVYESQFYDRARAAEFDTVDKSHVQKVRSELTGIELEPRHNNMTPFYRGSGPRQNVDPNANSSLLETFGTRGELKRKKEISPLFAPEVNVNQFDPTQLDGMKDRFVESKIRNNVLPFQQIKVGPGVGKGFESSPTGGFQQLDLQDFTIPKNVDELRAANNPKTTFEGRTVDGKSMVTNRGSVGEVSKNRTEKLFELGPDRYMHTTGANLKEAKFPEPDMKDTNRIISTEYTGAAHLATKGDEQRPDIRGPLGSRSDFDGQPFQIGGIMAGWTGRGAQDDFGKVGIQVYGNERDVTTVRTHKSNLTSVVKSIIAPIQDMIKINRKEFFVEPAREFGPVSVQIPKKATVKDPNDVLRTTIKETLIHDADHLNVWGHGEYKGSVYITDQIRTTIRNTVDPMETHLNLSVGMPSKPPIKDPNDVAKTTIKETTMDVDQIGFINGVTNRRDAAYIDSEFDMKTPQKVLYEDIEHFGGVAGAKGGGDGYKVQNYDMKATMKEDPQEYFGDAGRGEAAEKTMSYADIYAATTNSLRHDALVVNHEPTQNSSKVSQGPDTVVMTVMRQDLPSPPPTVEGAGARVITNIVVPIEPTQLTHKRQDLRQDDRLDIEMLEPFKKNPYTQPLDSAA